MRVLTAPHATDLPHTTAATPDLPMETRTDVEAWRARIEAKRADAARRRELDAAAAKAPVRPLPAALREKPAPKPRPRTEPKPRAPRAPRSTGPAVRPCVQCDHPTRPVNARADEHPGTRRRRSGGLCNLCYTGGPKPRPERQPKPQRSRPPAVRPCVTCDRPTRPGGSTAEQHPGTLLRANATQCHTCATTGGPPQPRAPRPPRPPREAPPQRPVIRPCTACGRPTRPSTLSIEDHPGTVVRTTADLCARCYDHALHPERASRPHVPTAELIRLYADENLGSGVIGRQVGLSPQAVVDRLRKAGVTIRPRGFRLTPPEGSKPKDYNPVLIAAVRQLAAHGLSQVEIADELATTRKVVWRVMARYDIPALPQVARQPRDHAAGLKADMAAAAVTSADVRAWARATGLHVPDRGLPPAALFEAYRAAHETTEASA